MSPSDTLRLLTASQDKGLHPNALGLLMALARFANTKWQCHPGIRKLSELSGVNKNTTIRTIRLMEEWRIITVDRKDRSTHHYHILAPRHWKLSATCRQQLSASARQFCPTYADRICPTYADSEKLTSTEETVCIAKTELGRSVGSLRSGSCDEDTQAHGGKPVVISAHLNGSALRVFEG